MFACCVRSTLVRWTANFSQPEQPSINLACRAHVPNIAHASLPCRLTPCRLYLTFKITGCTQPYKTSSQLIFTSQHSEHRPRDAGCCTDPPQVAPSCFRTKGCSLKPLLKRSFSERTRHQAKKSNKSNSYALADALKHQAPFLSCIASCFGLRATGLSPPVTHTCTTHPQTTTARHKLKQTNSYGHQSRMQDAGDSGWSFVHVPCGATSP